MHEVLIRVPVAEGTKKKDMMLEIHPKRLALSLRGEQVLAGDYGDKSILVDGAWLNTHSTLSAELWVGGPITTT